MPSKAELKIVELLEAISIGAIGGGSAGLPDYIAVLYTDDTGAQFVYREDTPGVLTAYLLHTNVEYTVGANPRPYALQNIQIASTDLGEKADTPATTDTGTFSLISLFKRSLQKLTNLLGAQYLDLSEAPLVLAIAATSAASTTALNALTNRIVLTSTVDCWVTIGATPVAIKSTSGSFFLSAGIPSYPIIVLGGTDKIAVIRESGDGYLSILPSK